MRDTTHKVNMLPTQIEQLTPSHAGLYGKDDQRSKQRSATAVAGR
jgi:hypothetical protein